MSENKMPIKVFQSPRWCIQIPQPKPNQRYSDDNHIWRRKATPHISENWNQENAPVCVERLTENWVILDSKSEIEKVMILIFNLFYSLDFKSENIMIEPNNVLTKKPLVKMCFQEFD